MVMCMFGGKKRKIRGKIMYIKGRYISIKGVVCCFYFIASYIYTEHSSEGILFTFNNLDAVKLFRNFHFVFVCLHETTLLLDIYLIFVLNDAVRKKLLRKKSSL